MAYPDSVNLSYKEAMTTRVTSGGIPLGTRGTTPDGRVFRWAKNGAVALVAGLSVSPPAFGLNAVCNTSEGVKLYTGTTVKTTENVIKITGSFSTVGFSADVYAGGWLLVGATWDVAAPMALKIKSHTAAVGGGTSYSDDTPTYITLEDGVFPSTAFNTSMGLALVKSMYNGVLATPGIAVPLLPAIGVPIVAVTASYYFWLQTWGPCMVRMAEVCSSGLVLGRGVFPSHSAATTGCYVVGSSNYSVTESVSPIGILMTPGAAGGYAVVDLKILP
jgi:hypothetical protein